MIILYRVVDDDGEEDNGAAKQTVYKRVGEFSQPGLLVKGVIGAEQGIEEKPAHGDSGCSQPEPGRKQQPVIDKNGFGQQHPATEVKNIGGKKGRDIVAEDIPKDRDGW